MKIQNASTVEELRDQSIRDSDGFIVVYSISDKESFETAEKLCEQVRGRWPELPIMLVGNNRYTSNPKVSTQDVQDLGAKLGCGFIQTGGDAVRIQFLDAIRELLRLRKNILHPNVIRNYP